MNKIFKINSCEVCNNHNLTPVLDLGSHPICDELIPVGSSENNELYPINIHYCENCYTAHQTTQIPKTRLFPSTYHYRARFTADVLTGMENLTQYLSDNFIDLKDKKVMDIGCNDGSLLDFFKQKGALTYGVEPTDAAYDAQEKKHNVICDYFTPELALTLEKVDVVTFTNVFAHIEDLKNLLKAVQTILKPDSLLVVENHYLGGVLGKNQFDTFYHEHPRTYSLNSFVHIAKTLGLDILSVEFPSRYGGNIRVVIGNKEYHKVISSDIDNILKEEGTFIDKFKKMNEFINEWKVSKKEEILNYIKENGKIKAKAFPARAAIPIHLLNLTEEHIECIYEKPGSIKTNHYVPGTRIPIIEDNVLEIKNEKGLLNNAWHISTEIKTYLEKLGFKGKIIDII
jgi:SAM-dependent methyltransferase